MSLFHDEENGPSEPIRGLPELLPAGEEILWQGKPSARALAIHAFHVRFIALWFVGMTGWRMAAMSSNGAPAADYTSVALTAAGLGVAGLAVVFGLAWAVARSTIFTLTNKRLVIRHGAAIRKYINLPFSRIVSADLKHHGRGRGDIALTLQGKGRIGYLHLWPYARPFKFAPTEPLLRGLPDAEAVAARLADAARAAAPDEVRLAPEGRSAGTPARPVTTPQADALGTA